jgi:mRNA interferase HigB
LVVISRKPIREFGEKHPDAVASLAIWYRTVSNADWKSTAELKATLKDADIVGDKTVFNIAQNRYRLIAFIAYKIRTVYVKGILTHREYDKGKWK